MAGQKRGDFTARVAPHAGAWIETIGGEQRIYRPRLSHPTRVRGLKPGTPPDNVSRSASHPTRVRGLKHPGASSRGKMALVAPHAGAWIETLILEPLRFVDDVAPHAGAWIETPA